jgi:5-formyltetrahydrofolate cyclo-ligase
MGIWQPPQDHPVGAEQLDLLIVPGVGFDRTGHRLGYGGGFYDHYLEHYPGWTIGLGFDCQLVDALPRQPHDHPIRMLITEKGVLRF